MPNDEKVILAKLVDVVEFLCQETANLVDDYSSRVTRDAVGETRDRAEKLRAIGQEIRKAAGTSPHSQDQQKPDFQG